MVDRETALRKVAVGDIFHARSSNRASLTCLVTAIDEGVIRARRIHTQDDVQFDRNTGFELGKAHTRIDCVAPLPPEVHTIFVEFDKRYQAMMQPVRRILKQRRHVEEINRKRQKSRVVSQKYLDKLAAIKG